ncbi:uncharacterized protein ATC70_003959 [Mucor velutinosus]|uniref:F-box domain-containing protein n=1 Tax=Mucor velutinosus TaxID=708070 RepID=A0AAN7DA87_9FUNG|nr:hypothetical protein ATC70_003959 [Mucor velutinosus]
MTVSWSSMPPELWSIVFKHTHSIKTVAKCRLVCKTWDPLAERAMFSKSLSVYGTESIVKLCNRLQENPALRYYIRSLYLGSLKKVQLSIQEDLFKLVMNPNIVSLEGYFDKAALAILLKAVSESGEQCSKLESLITYEGITNGGDSYMNAQLYFRTSLQELRLSLHTPHTAIYQTVVDHLEQFNSLKKLVLTYSDRHVLPELEQVLRKCQRLELIDFDIGLGETHWISKDDLKQWMISNVQQSPTLRFVDVGENHHPHLIEYLVYKYPNIPSVAISGAFTDGHGTIGRILDAVKGVGYISLRHWYLGDMEAVEQVLSTLKNKNNIVILRSCSPYCSERGIVYLTAHKTGDNKTTHYMINISDTEFPAVFSKIIKIVGTSQNFQVDYIDDDITFVESGLANQQSKSFKRMVKIISEVKSVNFTCAHIPYPSFSVNTSLSQVETLKICGAVIDQKVLTVLSRITPKLKSLTLSSCILNPARPQCYRIDMPHTDFSTLSINSEYWIWERDDNFGDVEHEDKKLNEALDKIISNISIKQHQMVSLKITSLSSNQKHYYALTPGDSAVVKAISNDEYSKSIARWPSIVIVCKSLETLKLDLGALLVELKPGSERPIESLGHWKRGMEIALLKDLYHSEHI